MHLFIYILCVGSLREFSFAYFPESQKKKKKRKKALASFIFIAWHIMISAQLVWLSSKLSVSSHINCLSIALNELISDSTLLAYHLSGFFPPLFTEFCSGTRRHELYVIKLRCHLSMNIMLWAVIKHCQQKKSTTTSMTPWGFLRKLFLLRHVRTVSDSTCQMVLEKVQSGSKHFRASFSLLPHNHNMVCRSLSKSPSQKLTSISSFNSRTLGIKKPKILEILLKVSAEGMGQGEAESSPELNPSAGVKRSWIAVEALLPQLPGSLTEGQWEGKPKVQGVCSSADLPLDTKGWWLFQAKACRALNHLLYSGTLAKGRLIWKLKLPLQEKAMPLLAVVIES